MPFDTSRLIHDEYRVIKKLDSGGQGSVYLVKHNDGTEHAAKVSRGRNSLKAEYRMYKRLGCVGRFKENFPRIYLHTRHGNYSVMVMSLFEKSLHDLKEQYGGTLSPACVLKAAIHLVKVIRDVHSQAIVHLDLKPSNVVMRTWGERKNVLHIIDFGMARLFKSRRSGKHISDGRARHFQGTPFFASHRAHQYRRSSRRDDLESLGYLLVYLAAGNLPWSDLSNSHSSREFREMGRMKKCMPVEEICEGTVGLVEYMKAVRSLTFSDRPHYSLLIDGLQRELYELTGEHKYDWE